MEYTLMHKDNPVIELRVDDVIGCILKTGNLVDRAHLPVGVPVKKDRVDRNTLQDWWGDRAIPYGRKGVKEAMMYLGISDTQYLLTQGLGLSLSDSYWIRPKDSNLRWNDINYYDNNFSGDLGEILLRGDIDNENPDLKSPDSSSDGFLRKRWIITEGERVLLKAGSAPSYQQPFNEVVACKAAERLNIPHIAYSVVWDGGEPFSACADFTSPSSELVPAWRVMQSEKKDNSTSVYRHLLNRCGDLGIESVEDSLGKMVVLDYLIANEDRHFNNFGFMRDPDTLEWQGSAPLFDSGSSLGYNKFTNNITPSFDIECKPFKKSHDDQLMLVKNWEQFDFSRLDGFDKEMKEIFGSSRGLVDEERTNRIVYSFESRVEKIKTVQEKLLKIERDSRKIADVSGDVEKNVSAQYNETVSHGGVKGYQEVHPASPSGREKKNER